MNNGDIRFLSHLVVGCYTVSSLYVAIKGKNPQAFAPVMLGVLGHIGIESLYNEDRGRLVM
jgi:hypothetical protein